MHRAHLPPRCRPGLGIGPIGEARARQMISFQDLAEALKMDVQELMR
jgi:hypothetical protein